MSRVVHPVPLAVHDVVADLHVLQDLGRRQGGGAGGPSGRLSAASSSARADHREAAVHLDHALDVAAVAFAEVGVDLVVDRVELAAELLDLLGREVARAGSRSRRWRRRQAVAAVIEVASRLSQSSISIGPSGALTQVRTISPSLPWTSPVRRSRTSPRAQLADAGVADAHPAAEGQRGAGLLAGDEDRRAAVALGLDAALREADRAALAARRRRRRSSAGSAPCGAARGRPRAPSARSSASSISAGPETKVSRSRQSGQSSSRSAGAMRPSLAGDAQVQVEAVAGASSSSRSRSPKITPSARPRRVDVDDVADARRGGRGCAACS